MLQVAGCSGFKFSSKHLMHIKLCSTVARLSSVKYPSQSEDSSLDMSRIYVYAHIHYIYSVFIYIYTNTHTNTWLYENPGHPIQRKPNPGSYQSLSFANRWLYLRPFSNSLWKLWRRFFALLPLWHENGYLDLYRTHLGTVWKLICCERLECPLFIFFFSFFWGGLEHVLTFHQGLLVSNSLFNLPFFFIRLFETRFSFLGELCGRSWKGWSLCPPALLQYRNLHSGKVT